MPGASASRALVKILSRSQDVKSSQVKPDQLTQVTGHALALTRRKDFRVFVHMLVSRFARGDLWRCDFRPRLFLWGITMSRLLLALAMVGLASAFVPLAPIRPATAAAACSRSTGIEMMVRSAVIPNH